MPAAHVRPFRSIKCLPQRNSRGHESGTDRPYPAGLPCDASNLWTAFRAEPDDAAKRRRRPNLLAAGLQQFRSASVRHPSGRQLDEPRLNQQLGHRRSDEHGPIISRGFAIGPANMRGPLYPPLLSSTLSLRLFPRSTKWAIKWGIKWVYWNSLPNFGFNHLPCPPIPPPDRSKSQPA